MEIVRKANKDHVCDLCEKTILKGSKYVFQSSRGGSYDTSDEQDGIQYFRMKFHLPEEHCTWPEDCKRGIHEFIYESGYRGDQLSGMEEGYYCSVCGHYLTAEEYEAL